MYVSSACTKHRFAESQSVSQLDKVQARTESCLCGYWYTKQLYLPFTGFICYVVICLNIYMVSFTWKIIYPQSCLSYLLKQPYEFKKFCYYHFTHGKQRHVEYYHILFRQNVKGLSKQTCMIIITQQDVKIRDGNPSVIPCHSLHLF